MPRPSVRPLPPFVSKQVTEARRFFLNLNPGDDSSLEVVCGGVERTRAEYEIQREDFPYYAVEFVAEGEGTLQLNHTAYTLQPGSLFAYGPGFPHSIRNHPEHVMRKYYLDFVGTEAITLLKNAHLYSSTQQYMTHAVGRIHEVTEVFELLLRNGHNSGPLVSPICNSLLELLFLKIREVSLPQEIARPQAYFTYERVRQYIDEHFLQLESAQDIAGSCEMTAVHLSRLFGRFADCGAYQYLLRRKMNFAAGLLMNEGLLVKDVAARLNYADPFRFSRTFKRVYGIPPTQLTRNGLSLDQKGRG